MFPTFWDAQHGACRLATYALVGVLARGVYCRPERCAETAPLPALAGTSGRWVARWRQVVARLVGVRHYVSQQPVLELYGWTAAKLPDWFTERFPAKYHRKRLFDEPPSAPLYAGLFEQRSSAPRVSAPERGLLEVLSEVGVRQPLQEARELAESTYSMRADVLRELLQRCTSVKTVRLCLQLGRELSLPWASKLDPAQLPTGSARAWVSRSADGLLVLKP